MAVMLASDVATPLSIASACAIRQARGAGDTRSRVFFSAQAKHERFHAVLFQQAARRLDPTNPGQRGTQTWVAALCPAFGSHDRRRPLERSGDRAAVGAGESG